MVAGENIEAIDLQGPLPGRLGIDPLPEARRRGYALAASMLWTCAIIEEGRIPFYSALAENSASRALAHKAGYRAFARGISFASI